MGLRKLWSRPRASGESGERSTRRASDAAIHRHQAHPATGELMRYSDEAHASPAPTRTRSIEELVPTLPAPPRPAPRAAPPASAPPASAPPASAPPAIGPQAGLVMGPAERREAPVELPATYAAGPKPYDRSAVQRAWHLVGNRGDTLVRTFYAELFVALGDEALRMFPSGMAQQREDFGRALVQWVVTDDPDAMTAHLRQLGADHRKFEVEPQHYDLAGTALVNAFRTVLGTSWSDEFERAITGSYHRLAATMLDGALAHRAEPPSWGATVVGHWRVLQDFAVVRVQPDLPYAYRAGQYLTVEVGSHRRQWRQMSLASAPRGDNTFDLHVRSVNATGVSAALVMHTKVGDRVRLGPPRGNDLVVEPGTVPAGLLCVCSGTGVAPISAVVESVAAWPECPPLYAFVGARTARDMYPVEQLNRLVHRGGRGGMIQVHPVVSDDPSYTGLRGRVEQVVPTLKDWAQLGVDVLVAGPNAMIATTVGGLTHNGVPLDRIHFDQFDNEV